MEGRSLTDRSVRLSRLIAVYVAYKRSGSVGKLSTANLVRITKVEITY
jgi:hypothetical protein